MNDVQGSLSSGIHAAIHLNLKSDAWETSALRNDLRSWLRPQLSTLRSHGCGERGFGMRSVVRGVGRRGYGQRRRQRRSAEGLPGIRIQVKVTSPYGQLYWGRHSRRSIRRAVRAKRANSPSHLELFRIELDGRSFAERSSIGIEFWFQ